MSGRQKRVFYAVYSIVLALCAVAGTALLLAFGVREGGPLDPITVPVWIAVGAAVAAQSRCARVGSHVFRTHRRTAPRVRADRIFHDLPRGSPPFS